MHPDETLCSSINKWAVLDQNKLQSQPDCVSVRLERRELTNVREGEILIEQEGQN